MTRTDALKKIGDVAFMDRDSWLLHCLGVLGLLNLDEPKCAEEIARETIAREVGEWNMIRNGSVNSADVAGSMLRAFDRADLKLSVK